MQAAPTSSAIGALGDQGKGVLDTDQRARWPGQVRGRQRPEDGIDRPPLESELAQVSAVQQPGALIEQIDRRGPLAHGLPSPHD
jgi:hypothetical protein